MSVDKYAGLRCDYLGSRFDATVTRNISIENRAKVAMWMGWKTIEHEAELKAVAIWTVINSRVDFNSLDDCDHISRHVMTLPRVVQDQYLMQLLQETMGNRVKEEKLDATKHHLSAIVAFARPLDRVRAALTIIGMMDKGWPNEAQVKEMQVVAGSRESIEDAQVKLDEEQASIAIGPVRSEAEHYGSQSDIAGPRPSIEDAQARVDETQGSMRALVGGEKDELILAEPAPEGGAKPSLANTDIELTKIGEFPGVMERRMDEQAPDEALKEVIADEAHAEAPDDRFNPKKNPHTYEDMTGY